LQQSNYTGAPEAPDGFLNLKTSFPATRRFHTVIVHGVVWSLVQMERWLICINKFFHLALKRYLNSKTVRFSGALCIQDPLGHCQIV
jgi:hypothetical protein